MRSLLAVLFVTLLSVTAHASTLPEFTGQWVNGGPYTREGLRNKIAVLYFYEEGCPTCRGKWPDRLALSKKYENEPVVFIAVNSGNTKPSVKTYLDAVKSDWPGYVDTDRSFEKNFGFEISTKNIFQMVVVDGNGNCRGALSSDPSGAITQAMSTVSWKVQPADVPDALKKAWRALEFGQTSVAAPIIKQALSAGDAKVKDGAKKLESVILEDIKKRSADGAAKNEAGQKWEAYKAYAFIAENYKDFPDAKPAIAEVAKLKSDKTVARELQAKTMFDKCSEWNQSPKKAENQQAQQGLQALAAQFADTEAGTSAKALLK